MVRDFAGRYSHLMNPPFPFWINNDWDVQDGGDKQSFTFQNCNNDVIDGQRDLEDFARLWVCGIPAIRALDGYRVELSIGASTGNPSINLCRSRDPAGGIGYLTSTNAAADQFTKMYLEGQLIFDYGRKLATISPGSSYTIPLNSINRGLSFDHFLFEGAGKGTGRLVLTVYKDQTMLAETSAYIDLRDVKEMYEQAIVTNVQQQWPEMVDENRVSGFQIHHAPDPAFDGSKEVAVFVHGWRMPNWEYFNFAETMYKRMYWQGYQGRFAALRWPTLSGDTDWEPTDTLTFNRSEHIAFKSGTGTAAYLNNLRQRFPNHTISICAHSMGNIVMMQALKELAANGQSPLNNYVLMQAAVPSQCFDTNAPFHSGLVYTDFHNPTPDTYRHYAIGTSEALLGNYVNFFNIDDYALEKWVLNQDLMKPLGLFGYYVGPGVEPYCFPSRLVTDPREVMPFLARARSYAVGAQGGVQGEILGGESDLKTSFGFGQSKSEHSGQFNWNIHSTRGCYTALRSSLFPTR